MSTLRYRFAGARDAQLLARLNLLLVEDGADFGSPDPGFFQRRMQRWLGDGHNRAVLFEDERGRLQAYAVYKEDAAEIYLRQFLVLRAARRRGVGREAYTLLRTRIWNADKRLTLEVLSANRAAYRFWRSLGYRDCAVTLEIPSPVPAPAPRVLPAAVPRSTLAWMAAMCVALAHAVVADMPGAADDPEVGPGHAAEGRTGRAGKAPAIGAVAVAGVMQRIRHGVGHRAAEATAVQFPHVRLPVAASGQGNVSTDCQMGLRRAG